MSKADERAAKARSLILKGEQKSVVAEQLGHGEEQDQRAAGRGCLHLREERKRQPVGPGRMAPHDDHPLQKSQSKERRR